MSDRLLAIGADGARGGWLAALGYGGDDGVNRLELRLVGDFARLASLRADGGPMAVDVPMGLLESVALRKCDAQARRLLGKRASTIFAPPSRPLLEAASYPRAREMVARERASVPGAGGVSAQAFGIAPKIREADGFLQANPGAQDWLWECHPELSFRAMAGGTPLPDKKSIGGQAHRLALLRERLPGVLDALRRVEAGRRHAEPADALDALACLQTALRVRSGSYEQLGGDPDATGLSMRIVF